MWSGLAPRYANRANLPHVGLESLQLRQDEREHRCYPGDRRHTGLWAIDYADYPPFPYRAKNWRLELLAPEEKRNSTSMVRGDETFRARELAIFSLNPDSAQRAALAA